MQPNEPTTASPIPLPAIETDEPVAVIPVASVAPLDGPPDGERINIFAVAPKKARRGANGSAPTLEDLREGVLRNPLTSAAVAFTLGYFFARIVR
jgi:hypothetical protein